MARSVPEWIGKTPDTAIPARVRNRVYNSAKGDGLDPMCAICTRTLMPWDSFRYDHIIALVNGGENRESNIQLLCTTCHTAKTATDVAEKATVARKRKKHLGIKKKQTRPLMGTKASGWRKRMNGTVEKRK